MRCTIFVLQALLYFVAGKLSSLFILLESADKEDKEDKVDVSISLVA